MSVLYSLYTVRSTAWTQLPLYCTDTAQLLSCCILHTPTVIHTVHTHMHLLWYRTVTVVLYTLTVVLYARSYHAQYRIQWLDETSSCTLKEMMDWQGTRSAVVHIHSLSCGGSELCLRSQQLQPTRKSTNIPHKKPKAWLPCLDHMRNSIATKQKYWWIPNKTFKRSHGTCALMRREISGHQTRQITFIWMLQANSSHHAFHQLTQYVVIFRPKACVTIQVGEAVLWTQHGTL